jgi:hypothetical protein
VNEPAPYQAICTHDQYLAYLDACTAPPPQSRSLLPEGRVGLVLLDPTQFRYFPPAGYEFEVAAMMEAGTARRLLFIRIDSWDPHRRATGPPADYVIPIVREGASPRERLLGAIPFGGGWADARTEALLVFPESWADWFRGLRDGIAFANPGENQACILRFGGREKYPLRAFCGGPFRLWRL